MLFLVLLVSAMAQGQEVRDVQQKYIFFPHPLNAQSRFSIGVTSTVMPQEITEEVHFRIPAVDLHLMKKMTDHMDLDARVFVQVVQNMIMLGPKWSAKVSDRVSMSAGNQIGFWFGVIKLNNVDTRGRGWQNYPHLSVGYRFNKEILLTLRAESIMNLNVYTKAGEIEVKSDYRLFNGSAYSLMLEQPFAGKKSVTLGFRALYTDYYWQTWTLFENYDRNLFFPQFTVGFIL